MKVYFYPPKVPPQRDIVINPYSINFMEALSLYCDVVNINSTANISILNLCKNIFNIDTIIFNWIENLGVRKAGKFQFILFLFAFFVLKIRRVKIIWVFHNIHPHQGESKISKWTKQIMYRHSHLIVTHSKEAAKYLKAKTTCPIAFYHHPLNTNLVKKENITHHSLKKSIDLLIWGSIEPYKGILEFLKYLKDSNKKWKVKIAGKCTDSHYEKELKEYLSENISFENKKIPFCELKNLIDKSKYVIFPYLSSSVSSSGALMDTIVLGGNIIGPNKGAFNDLAKQNICNIYQRYDDISHIMSEEKPPTEKTIKGFIEENSWHVFSRKLISQIQ
jgi:glycosyltransferase involved in cell wall biosynthesis